MKNYNFTETSSLLSGFSVLSGLAALTQFAHAVWREQYLLHSLYGLMFTQLGSLLCLWAAIFLCVGLPISLAPLLRFMSFKRLLQEFSRQEVSLILIWAAIFLLGFFWGSAIRIDWYSPLLVAYVAAGIVLIALIQGRLGNKTAAAFSRAIPYFGRAFCIAALLAESATATHFNIRAPSGPNIIVLTVDCLRKDALQFDIHSSTTPNIAKLAQSGTVFRNNFTTSPWTKPAVASLFTGLTSIQHGVISYGAILPNQLVTIAELVKDAGYRTVFFNAGNHHLKPYFSFDQGFDEYHLINQHNAHALVDKFAAWLNPTKKRPFFAYLHLMDLHIPFDRDAQITELVKQHDSQLNVGSSRLLADVDRLTAENQLTAADRQLLLEIYQQRLKRIDAALGRLQSRLAAAGIAGDTVIMLTSDHGEEFWDHGGYEHGHTLYNELLAVPLIAAGPGFAGGVVDLPTALLDLPATIAGLARARAPLQFTRQGRDLLAAVVDESHNRRLVCSGVLYADGKHALIAYPWKLVHNTGIASGKVRRTLLQASQQYELYQLSEDPAEQNNLYQSQPAVAQRLRAALKAAAAVQAASIEIELNAETKKALDSLGYL